MIGVVIHYLPYGLVPAFGLVVLKVRQLSLLYFFGGVFINEGLNFALKHVIKQERPRGKSKGYGMPSAHAQFSSFLFSYSRFWFNTRIYHGYHSFAQVFVGILFGLLIANLLKSLWLVALTYGLQKKILDLSIAKFFGVHDLPIPI
ncbi:hypothetical protein BB560_005729 [Smittium megazygosporum]|uniref:Phosphatidic acid phosphatase type 2/haloperoxidase domain-containing protein n=1 Tax=Smittium megazygosporum TaxID=133381 RepID=A0A2T9YZ91_9FUNG|nr:hypothetical protein BB560_005729 [Smittium megazygosporum]